MSTSGPQSRRNSQSSGRTTGERGKGKKKGAAKASGSQGDNKEGSNVVNYAMLIDNYQDALLTPSKGGKMKKSVSSSSAASNSKKNKTVAKMESPSINANSLLGKKLLEKLEDEEESIGSVLGTRKTLGLSSNAGMSPKNAGASDNASSTLLEEDWFTAIFSDKHASPGAKRSKKKKRSGSVRKALDVSYQQRNSLKKLNKKLEALQAANQALNKKSSSPRSSGKTSTASTPSSSKKLMGHDDQHDWKTKIRDADLMSSSPNVEDALSLQDSRDRWHDMLNQFDELTEPQTRTFVSKTLVERKQKEANSRRSSSSSIMDDGSGYIPSPSVGSSPLQSPVKAKSTSVTLPFSAQRYKHAAEKIEELPFSKKHISGKLSSKKEVEELTLIELLQSKVTDVMKPLDELWTVNASDTAEVAFDLLFSKGILSVPVLDYSSACLGFVDMLDLVAFTMDHLQSRLELHEAAAKGSLFDYIPDTPVIEVIDLSDRNPYRSLTMNATVVDVLSELVKVHRVAIVDHMDRMVGLITQSTFAEWMLKKMNNLKSDIFDRTVEQEYAQSRKRVVSVTNQWTALDVFHLLYEKELSGVPIVNDMGRVEDSCSATDLRGMEGDLMLLDSPVENFLAETRKNVNLKKKIDHSRRQSSQQQTQRRVIYSRPNSPLRTLFQKMVVHHLHRIFVLNANMRPWSVVTLSDLIGTIYNQYLEDKRVMEEKEEQERQAQEEERERLERQLLGMDEL